jgi:hypothetical protein
MLIRPIPAPRRARSRVRDRSRLSATILRMIGSNSLAAFAQAISRSSAAQPVRGVQGTASQSQEAAGGIASNRPLEAVPPQPARPLPRGSLLDLRV